jgi:hypothetical protein
MRPRDPGPAGGEPSEQEPARARAEARDGEASPGRRPSRRRARKERVLHTRISEPLAEDIRRLAEELRVPVSNIVRNVLEEAFNVVETVTDNVGELIDDVVEEADRARGRIRRRRPVRRRPAPSAERAAFPSVIGWQPMILNRRGSCADCEEALPRGERAYAGITDEGFSSILLCRDCMDARR